MNNILKLIIVFLTTLINSPCIANVIVSVQDVPVNTNGMFSAKISGASINDPTPNPCYGRDYRCRLKFFTIDESWLPGGRTGYNTVDEGFQTSTGGGSVNADHLFKTVGEWWRDVINKERVGKDYLPAAKGTSPCVVLAAHMNTMIEGTIVSNCAKGIVQVPTCAMSVQTIDIQEAIAQGEELKETTKNGLSVSCDYTSDVKIETNTNEEIPLGGNSTSVAVLDWGNGYGRPGYYHVNGGTATPVRLRVKTRGLRGSDAGVYAGSAVVNVSYQ